jgi:quercetin dioxygenase-like cupin family protein
MACRTASLVASAALLVAGSIAACRDAATPSVPPVTSAHPTASTPVLSGPAVDPKPTGGPAAAPSEVDAGGSKLPVALFIEGAKKVEAPVCSRLVFAALKGTVSVHGSKGAPDNLAAGDVLVITHPSEPLDVNAPGLAAQVMQDLACEAARPAKMLVRAKDVPEIKWAKGAMRAQLLVTKDSPELYVGRLEGTAPVVEHDHPTSNETLITLEAAGTMVVDGKESRLGPRQIVQVPKGTKHAWRPDPGTKLVAVQIYDPPGPEQRFVGLAAADRDAGADGGRTFVPQNP